MLSYTVWIYDMNFGAHDAITFPTHMYIHGHA
jgi:hypothetical protein